MPSGLKRYQETKNLHFITFSCYQRRPFLASPTSRRIFEETLERVRRWYGMFVTGYVVMPEHVHLLISEPERGTLAVAIQMLKQITAQELRSSRVGVPPFSAPFAERVGLRKGDRADLPKRFWQVRYYDFNVHNPQKRIQKLQYLHRNPVRRGLVERPEDWAWSSFRHYATGEEGVVEIESEWTGRKRERMGLPLRAELIRSPVTFGDSGPTLSAKGAEKGGAPTSVDGK